MKHELTITHDKLIAIRPFGVTCDCGFKAAAETYAEAERIILAHQRLEQQKETLKARGYLK